MPLPELVRHGALRRLEAYCESRVPIHVRDQIRLELAVRGNAITILECRPPWREDYGPDWTRSKVAQVQFDPSSRTWELFAYDRNSRRMPYPFIEPSADLDELLAEIDSDPTCIFWG